MGKRKKQNRQSKNAPGGDSASPVNTPIERDELRTPGHKRRFPSLGDVIIGTSALAFVCSTFWVKGFTVGSRLDIGILLDIGDHARLSAQWLPLVIAGVLVAIALRYFAALEGRDLASMDADPEKDLDSIEYNWSRAKWAWLISSIILGVSYYFIVHRNDVRDAIPFIGGLFFSFTWTTLHVGALLNGTIRHLWFGLPTLGRLASRWLPLLFILAFTIGWFRGLDGRSRQLSHDVQLCLDDTSCYDGKLILLLSDYVVLQDSLGEFGVFNRSDVQFIQDIERIERSSLAL